MRKILLITVFTAASFAQGIYATFNVLPKKSASLAFSTNGMVADVKVDIGSVVEKKQTLATLQNSDLQAYVSKARAGVAFAKKSYNRALKARAVQNRAIFDKFDFEYKSAKATLALALANYNKSILKAPFRGVITAKAVEVGDVVSAMAPRMLLKIESKAKKLVLEFDQKYLPSVKVGDTFKYKLNGSDKELSGKIVKVYPTIDARKRTAKAEVEAGNLASGLFGDGTIEAGDR